LLITLADVSFPTFPFPLLNLDGFCLDVEGQSEATDADSDFRDISLDWFLVTLGLLELIIKFILLD
jgi:hypothetical protein